MDRRKSIKTLVIGAAASGILVDACKPSDKKHLKRPRMLLRGLTG